MIKVRTLLAGFLLFACAAALVISAGCSSAGPGTALYNCPMHPQVTSDKPGDCPICGMKLVPVEKPGQEGAPKAADKVTYICPMHPQVTSEKPGDCSICGMHLVPKTASAPPAPAAPAAKKTMYRSTMNPNEVSDGPGKDSMGMEMVPFEVESPAGGVQGLAPVSISESQRRHMNLATAPVVRRSLSREVRTSARIVPDETRLYRVTAKLDGYVEKLHVNATGQAVKRGQPLLVLYSPDLVASQQELLTALAAARRLGQSPYPSVAKGGQDLVEAARRRLRLWDISEAQVARIEASGHVEETMTLYAPASGYVFEKSVLPGSRIMAGEPLLTLADLSSVWAEADVYEADLPYVKVGMPATLALSYLPGRSFPGRISFLNPFLDPQSRTLKARLEIPNPHLLLKPEMYGEATLAFTLGEKLAVPESAVLPSGKKNLVFVKGPEGTFTPAEVSLGGRGDGYFEVLSGLHEGDEVVTSANFLVDSESSLKAALQAVSGK